MQKHAFIIFIMKSKSVEVNLRFVMQALEDVDILSQN